MESSATESRHKIYYQNNKERRREESRIYYKNNKDKVKQKQKKYYEENKEELAKNSLEKIKCECGEYYTKKHKSRHEKSQLHQDIIMMNELD